MKECHTYCGAGKQSFSVISILNSGILPFRTSSLHLEQVPDQNVNFWQIGHRWVQRSWLQRYMHGPRRTSHQRKVARIAADNEALRSYG